MKEKTMFVMRKIRIICPAAASCPSHENFVCLSVCARSQQPKKIMKREYVARNRNRKTERKKKDAWRKREKRQRQNERRKTAVTHTIGRNMRLHALLHSLYAPSSSRSKKREEEEEDKSRMMMQSDTPSSSSSSAVIHFFSRLSSLFVRASAKSLQNGRSAKTSKRRSKVKKRRGIRPKRTGQRFPFEGIFLFFFLSLSSKSSDGRTSLIFRVCGPGVTDDSFAQGEREAALNCEVAFSSLRLHDERQALEH